MSEATHFTNDLDGVVISGVSGRFPDADNVAELKDKLFNGIDMVTTNQNRWKKGIFGLPERFGTMKSLSNFDSSYFGVHGKQSEQLDPQMRVLLEVVYEAIVDAGYNPVELRGKNIAVVIGIMYCDSTDVVVNSSFGGEYGATGCCLAMAANRTSFLFDFKGPSMAVDLHWSTSLSALKFAASWIKNGNCDAAIVGATTAMWSPITPNQYNLYGILSPDGKCKSYDKLANGIASSEGVVSVFLQKCEDARRNYANLINLGLYNDNHQEKWVSCSTKEYCNFLEKLYMEAGIDPAEVNYIEADGSGIEKVDTQELNILAETFCRNKKDSPLLIGAVKSNMGHTETASGLCSLVKMIIAMENLRIPKNLHYESPNPNIPGLLDGRLKIVDEHTEWKSGLAACNNLTFTGSFAHLIVKSNGKEQVNVVDDAIPKLVCVSGRTEEAVQYFLNQIENIPRSEDFITLLHKIHEQNITGHHFRGYTVLGAEKGKFHEVSNVLNQRSVWFVYTGMGGQWAGMGRAYMGLKPFSDAIHKCAKALTDVGVDLLYLINEADESAFKDIINNFVTLAAIQIALTDLLTALGIKPDGIVGHSAGEICCGYADGATNAEQTVLAAYWRGRTVLNIKPKPGLMAAVGLTWNEAKARCPEGIYPACHNGEASVTISGPHEDMEKFVKQLQDENIFAKIVDSSNIAFHCKYIVEAGAELQSALEKIIVEPAQRSSKWISSSIPEENWDSELAKTFSPAYQVNNLVSPVLFHDAALKIPPNTTVLEIAPHCLLQAILRKTLPNCLSIGLFKRHIPDELANFQANIGKTYLAGLNPNMSVFHTPTSFPVGRGTPMVGPLVKWDHSIDWNIPSTATANTQSGKVFSFNLGHRSDKYIEGHTIDGRVLFPATGYLELVWKAYGSMHSKPVNEFCVAMENIAFRKATIVPRKGNIKLMVSILKSSGDFEITVEGSTAVTGKIRPSRGITEEGVKNLPNKRIPEEENPLNILSKADIYKLFRLNGYEYKGMFQGIKNCRSDGSGNLEWTGNWVTFMDCMLQLSLISKISHRILLLPTEILQVIIDPQLHLSATKNKTDIPVTVYENLNVMVSGGIEIRGLNASIAPRKVLSQAPKLEQYRFVPYNINKEIRTEDAMTIALQIVLENSFGARKLNVIEAYSTQPPTLFAQDVINLLESEPMCFVNYKISIPNSDSLNEIAEKIGARLSNNDIAKEALDLNAHLIITSKLSENPSSLDNALASIKEGQFILTLEPVGYKNFVNETKVKVISQMAVENGIFVLLRKVSLGGYVIIILGSQAFLITKATEIIEITQSTFDWIPAVKKIMKEQKNNTLLVANDGPESGIIGLFNCLKQEPGGEQLRCVYIAEKDYKFNINQCSHILENDLLVNIFKGGEWGSFRHLLINFDKLLQVEHSFCNPLTRGDLSSFRWIESSLAYSKPSHYPGKEICLIYYSPLNFRDIMLASGKLSPPEQQADMESILGLEYTGRNSKGQRVMGIVQGQAFATSTIADPLFLWPIPDEWTMEQASSIPCVYLTCYYGMIMRGKMKRGESILIHAGSGGVGQAAMNIAFSMDCEVFTTVGSQQKKDFLLKNFPKLNPENIGNSRDASFEQLVMERTSGQGVDLVLNSLASELLQASVRCLGKNGRFLEIGKVDIFANSDLGMKAFKKNISFHGVMLDVMFYDDASSKKKLILSQLLSDGIASGVVKPLPVRVFENTEVEQAFRYMASGKHIGKVVVKIRNEEKSKILTDVKPISIPSLPRSYMDPDKSYIIIGGLGGFGLELTRWMLTRGAKNIILNSRSGITSAYQSLKLKQWQERCYNVLVSTADTTTTVGAKALLEEASRWAPVGGIFNLAVVLKDALMENQNEESFKVVFKSKVDSTNSLDITSRILCPELDFFVVFSSVSCGRGNAGQANYGMANSCMERICEKRHADGLPATAIQWGAIGDVGIVIEAMGGTNEMTIGGTLPQRIVSCMSTLDTLLQTPYPVVSSMVLAETRKKTTSISPLEAIGNILGYNNFTALPNTTSLIDLGMDSLMGVEIKQTLERDFDVFLSPNEIRLLTIGRVKELTNPSNQDELPKIESVDERGSVTPVLIPKNLTVKMKDGTSNAKTTWFFVHPIEGNVDELYGIAKSTSIDADIWGFQCTKDVPLDSIESLAKCYFDALREIQPNGPYKILGFSFGCSVSFQLGLMLENLNEKVNLIQLDGAHIYSSNRFAESGTLGEKDSEILACIVALLDTTSDAVKLIHELKILSDFQSRLNHATDLLAAKLPFHRDEIKEAALSCYRKLVAISTYTPLGTIKGDIVLIRSSETLITMKGESEDFGLSKVCLGNLRIVKLEGTHKSILLGEDMKQIAKVIDSIQ